VLDVEAAHGHYESLSPGLGQAFLDQVRDKLEHLSQMPTVHAIVWRNVCATILHRFPYVLYYRVLESSIEVLAIIHGSRDERAWKERV
jgi:plasmid stabilization system protein ParE